MMPILENENIEDAVIKELINTKAYNEKSDKRKIEDLERFLLILSSNAGNSEDPKILKNNKLNKIEEWLKKIEMNYKKRSRHIKYLRSIDEIITLINVSIESSKTTFEFLNSATQSFVKNVEIGYSNEFVKEITPLKLDQIDNIKKLDKSDKSSIKKFLVVKLISDKVIDEIVFENQNQPKLSQKSYLYFSKLDTGYKIKLVYKEKYRKFIICGLNNHEFVLDEFNLTNEIIVELRRIARTNSTYSVSEIRFNVFYLIKLLNSLEAQ